MRVEWLPAETCRNCPLPVAGPGHRKSQSRVPTTKLAMGSVLPVVWLLGPSQVARTVSTFGILGAATRSEAGLTNALSRAGLNAASLPRCPEQRQ
eukprot:scaffold1541_cov418-Prasinococcus_capsulatus_cf.AAC.7